MPLRRPCRTPPFSGHRKEIRRPFKTKQNETRNSGKKKKKEKERTKN